MSVVDGRLWQVTTSGWTSHGRSPPRVSVLPRSTTRRHLYRLAGDLYALDMSTLNITAFRANLPDAIETAKTEAVILERNGRPAAVMVSPERYDELMAAFEELEDAAAVDAALAEGGDPIPWGQVMKDLGWTT